MPRQDCAIGTGRGGVNFESILRHLDYVVVIIVAVIFYRFVGRPLVNRL